MARGVLVGLLVMGILATTGMTGWAQAGQRREPLLYGLASFFVPGLGQALQGELQTGLMHFGVGVAIPILGTYLAVASPAPALIWAGVGVAQLGWAVYSGFHSYDLAVAYNEQHGFGLSITLSFASR